MAETPSEAVAQLAAEFMDHLDEAANPDAKVGALLIAIWTEDDIHWHSKRGARETSDADTIGLAVDLAHAAGFATGKAAGNGAAIVSVTTLGDYFEVWAHHNGGSATEIPAGLTGTWIAGYWRGDL